MNGLVDADLRALLHVRISATLSGPKQEVLTWIDTAFNGGLVLPRQEIQRLQLKECSSTSAILADGSQVELAMYTCYLEWFGSEFRTQVVANDGSHALLGTMLLRGHDLNVSYRNMTVGLR